MGLDYSQKRLLSSALRGAKKGRGHRRAMISSMSMRKREHFAEKLEIYAFWTGLMSTVISLVQVVIIALKK